jgi:hypothetical protein
MILLGRRVERRDPDGVDSTALEVLEPGGDAGQIADAVVIGVGEAPIVRRR